MKRSTGRSLRRKRASALLVALALITILTLILLAYFNVVSMDRMATRNYAQGLKADEVGRGAIDFVIGQLRGEMARGTTPLPVGTYSIFTNIVSANVLPEPIGTNATVPALVKMPSSGQGVYSNATVVAANAVSSNASANGRRITAGRWGRTGLGTPSAVPSWFLIGPGGITNVPSTGVEGRFALAVYDLGSLVDINVAGYPSTLSTSQKRALEGSLAGLDLSALGLSATMTDDLIVNFRNRASVTNYTNQILNIAATNGFMRVSPGDDLFLSRQDFLAYAKLKNLTNLPANFSTFTRTVSTPAWTPQTNAGSAGIQSITRSSIVQWGPSAGASTASPSVSFDYQTLSSSNTSTNRNFLTQPVTAVFTRFDGADSIVGEPLVLKRFPLSRLAWLSKDGPSALAVSRFGGVSQAAAMIKAAFGLVWDSANRLWVYTSPTSTNGGGNFASGNSDGPASGKKAADRIKILAVVASEKRDADFFELLQAAILRGSLGQHSSIANPEGIPHPGEVTPEGHIFQIGANIIDQYDEDDFPTLIRAYMPVVMDDSPHQWDSSSTTGFVLGSGAAALTPHDFAGVENLPYLMTFRSRAYRPQAGNSSDGARRFGEAIFMPQFWNPHQNAANLAADRPQNLRIIQTFGEMRMAFMGNKRGSTDGTQFIDSVTGDSFGYVGYLTSPPSAWPSPAGQPQPMIAFRGDAAFAQPGFLTPAQVTATSIPQNVQTALVADAHTVADLNPTGFVGFWMGRVGTTVTTSPVDEAGDDTPIDREVWAAFTGRPIAECPVQQYISSVALPVDRNSLDLSAADRFWKGDTVLAASYRRRYPVFELQYQDGGVWKTYQRFDGAVRGGGADHKWDTMSRPAAIAGSFTSESHDSIYGRIDPRGSRFGLIRMDDPAHLNWANQWNGDPSSYATTPMAAVIGYTGRPNGEASVNFNGTPLAGNQSGAQFTDTFNPSSDSTRWIAYPVWQWTDNKTGGQRYTDNDRILRRSDGRTASGVDPLAVNTTTARPVVLNRAFTSVGDLGYVFRDLPFKTLDLFSAESADAGLLDVFSVDDAPTVIAGKLNLNGRNVAVLKQALSGAIKKEISKTALTDAEAGGIASALADGARTNALTGLWDLPRFLSGAAYASATTGELQNVKTQMEAVPRRLSALADARCWNLLIDVVAQTGRYAPGVTNPDQFTVEGERRYWLQVAIDRVTGKIVDQQLEPVFE